MLRANTIHYYVLSGLHYLALGLTIYSKRSLVLEQTLPLTESGKRILSHFHVSHILLTAIEGWYIY